MTAFAHIITNHSNRAVIVKVTSKNMKVLIFFFYLGYISMYSGHMPFGQPVMDEEQIFNVAVSFKTCTKTLANVFDFGAASYYL